MADHSKDFKNMSRGFEELRHRRRTDAVDLRKKERTDRDLKRRNVTQVSPHEWSDISYVHVLG